MKNGLVWLKLYENLEKNEKLETGDLALLGLDQGLAGSAFAITIENQKNAVEYCVKMKGLFEYYAQKANLPSLGEPNFFKQLDRNDVFLTALADIFKNLTGQCEKVIEEKASFANVCSH